MLRSAKHEAQVKFTLLATKLSVMSSYIQFNYIGQKKRVFF